MTEARNRSGGWKCHLRRLWLWTGDGKDFIFQSNSGLNSDLWRLNGNTVAQPVRVTNGPLNFVAPATARIGHRIYFLGLDTQSTLEQFDAASKAFIASPEFLSQANRVEYSPDRQWVVWNDAAGRLWRARSDGSELIQVTPDSMQVFLAHWSPDGNTLAVMARDHAKAWQIYTVAPTGGIPQPLHPEARNQGDPSWSADGRRIVFGRVTDIMGKEDGPRALQIVDLGTGTIIPVPASQGLFSPRWSPDGKYIAALSLDQRKLLLFTVATQQWRSLSENTAADPVWSSDSQFLFFHAAQAEGQPLYRIRIANGNVEQVASLASFPNGATASYFFCGLTEDNQPIVRALSRTGDIYSVDLDSASNKK